MSNVYFIFILFGMISDINGANTTNKYLTMDNDDFNSEKYRGHGERKSRFVSFDSKNGAINVDLEFSVPFIEIPVKEAMGNLMKGLPLINVNSGSVLLTGMVLAAAVFVLPAVSGFFIPAIPLWSRENREETQDWRQTMSKIDETLLENNINATSCAQRTVCWVVKTSSHNVRAGKASSTDKIIDGLASNNWIKTMVSGSLVQEAVEAGYQDNSCSKTYPHCKITQLSLQKLIRAISLNSNNV